MSFCEFCDYDVPGPCASARLAARLPELALHLRVLRS